jgi:hypothetical protein
MGTVRRFTLPKCLSRATSPQRKTAGAEAPAAVVVVRECPLDVDEVNVGGVRAEDRQAGRGAVIAADYFGNIRRDDVPA